METRRRDANMQMIRERIFPVHTKRDENVHLKFTLQMRFGVLSVVPEKKQGSVGCIANICSPCEQYHIFQWVLK